MHVLTGLPQRKLLLNQEDIVTGVEQLVKTSDYIFRVGPRAVFGPTLPVLMHICAAGKRVK